MRSDPLKPTSCARMLAALAAPERLRIVRELQAGERSVSELTAALAVPMVNISHHLRVLRHAGIVSGRKQGRFVHYALRQSMIATPAGKDGRQMLDLGCCQLQFPIRRPPIALSKPT